MSDDALVTAAEVARLAGVGRAAVSNWRRRHLDFPEPVPGSGAAPAFRLAEVERWLRDQGKLTRTDPVAAVWRALEVSRGEGLVEGVADLAEYLRDGTGRLDPRVRDALEDLDDEPSGEVIEQLCTRLFERQQRQHLVTPPELAHMMVELAEPIEGSVLDPACGPGNLLRAAAERGAQRLIGQETSPALARLARSRLGASAEIREGDTLRTDAFPELRAESVICDPPFGYRDWGHEELAIDPRWEYGFPVKGEPELAWLQHCLAHVEPGGTVVLALPAGVASRRAGRSIRQALVRRGALRAVIALPARVLMSTGIPIHLWVLRNPVGSSVDPVLLVDTSEHQPQRRGRADWAALHAEVFEAWQEFRDTGTVEEVAGMRRAIEPIDLLDEDVDLTPSRHLPMPATQLDIPALERARAQLQHTLGDLGTALPTVRAASPEARTSTTIHDLARAGALMLRQQTRRMELEEDADGPLVLTGRDVVTGQDPTMRLADPEQLDLLFLQPGDLVVPLLAAGDGRPPVRVITGDELALGPNLQLIRVDADRLDVEFLAGQIRAGSSARASTSTLSGVHRLDVRRVEIPVLDLAQQQRLGALFQRLATFETELRQAANLGAELVRKLVDGLADGVVAPPE